MKEIRVGKKIIGEKRSVFIIAEAGVNHNGSLRLAKKLVDLAVDCGADAIKFQTFKTDKLVGRETPLAEYQKKSDPSIKNQFNLLKSLELSDKYLKEIASYCRKNDIIFSSTPHSSVEDTIILEKLKVPFYKIGSGDLNNLPFLSQIGKLKRPLILSTGMSSISEIKEAKKNILESRNNKIIFLHCTSTYPAEAKDLNLLAIKTMKKNLGLMIGYSDHSEGITASVIAVLLGAVVLEKHITLDRNLPGPDHKASLEKEEFKKYVKAVRLIEDRMKDAKTAFKYLEKKLSISTPKNINIYYGSGVKKIVKSELNIAKVARKGLYANKNLQKGKRIRENDVIIRRPKAFLDPKYLIGSSSIVGKELKRDVLNNKPLRLEYFK